MTDFCAKYILSIKCLINRLIFYINNKHVVIIITEVWWRHLIPKVPAASHAESAQPASAAAARPHGVPPGLHAASSPRPSGVHHHPAPEDAAAAQRIEVRPADTGQHAAIVRRHVGVDASGQSSVHQQRFFGFGLLRLRREMTSTVSMATPFS